MNWIVNLYYKIFYKKSGKQVMGVLINCEAYVMYEKAVNSYQTNLQNIVNSLDYNIRREANNGRFQSSESFSSKDISGNKLKFFKNIYIGRGYKVKIRRNSSYSNNKKIIVTWKNWRTE